MTMSPRTNPILQVIINQFVSEFKNIFPVDKSLTI